MHSEYAVFCSFADESTRELNISISRGAGEAEFMFEALSALSREERQKLTSLGTLRIASQSEPSLVADGEHWLRRSKLIHTNRYPFTVATK